MDKQEAPANLQKVAIESQDEASVSSKRGISVVFGVILMLITGGVIGWRSRTMFEAVVYSFMFILESLVCTGASFFSTSFIIQRTAKAFGILFVFSSVSCLASRIIENFALMKP